MDSEGSATSSRATARAFDALARISWARSVGSLTSAEACCVVGRIGFGRAGEEARSDSNAIKSEREEMGAAESFVVMARQGPATRIEECTHAPFDN